MEITNVVISLVNNKPRLKAIATITLDNEMSINGVQIIKKESGKLCVAFPKTKARRQFGGESIVLINNKSRAYFEERILSEYKNLKEEEK